MHGLWQLIKEGGWGAMLAVLLGGIGLLLGPAAGLTMVFSRRGAFWVGLMSLVVATLAAGVGLLGMSSGRRMTDGAVSGIGLEVTRERIRIEGYKESEGAAKVGFGASAVPLLFGLLAVALGAGARPKHPNASPMQAAYGPSAFAPPPPKPPSQGGRWIAGGVVASFALVTSVGALAASYADLPTSKYAFAPDDHDAWALAEARETFDGDQAKGCDDLDAALDTLWMTSDRRQWPRVFARDPNSLVPDWRNVATMCVQRMWTEMQAGRVVMTAPTSPAYVSRPPKTWDANALLDSPLLVDERLHTDVMAWVSKPGLGLHPYDSSGDAGGGTTGDVSGGGGIGLGNLGTMGGPIVDVFGGGGDGGAGRPRIRTGTTTVNGRLPPEVIQRIVRRNLARFRLCYEVALKKNSTLEGTVKTKFVIATDGTVSSATDGGSDLPDESVRSCVRRAFQGLSFPAPEGGIVVVTYPLAFSPSS